MSTIPDIDFALIKDLGGWAVVLLIVAWMRNLIEKLIASSDSNMRAVIQEFKEFRRDEAIQHENLEDKQDEILSHIRSLRR